MESRILLLSIMALTARGAPDKELKPVAEAESLKKINEENEDLKTASSSYSHQYSNWGGRYPSGYDFSVTGYGTVDDRARASYGDLRSNNIGYGVRPGSSAGYDGFTGYEGVGQTGYERGIGYGVNGGYRGNSAYGVSGVYGGNSGYGGSNSYGVGGGYGGNNGYGLSGGYGGSNGYRGNYPSNSEIGGNGVYYDGKGGYGGSSGNGGYGGYGGNGGLTSYYGYNNPYYQGNNHLGYGYYNRKPGYGSIHNNGITPSLVTGYRGYSR